jgi:radical SAM superfamily enzyme YgiQ (UPF0313 family)
LERDFRAREKMKILLISPCKDPDMKYNKSMIMPQLSLYLLAGLTPLEYEVTIIEEDIEDIDLDEDCDLVGLSCLTSNAPRAYLLAQEFKKKGKTVVMGGVHPTILPDEALQFADSVVIGEAEGVWQQLLEDFKNGRLQKKYNKPCPSLEKYIHIKHRRAIKKGFFNVVPVMTTRGCPYDCDFCCVHDIFGRKIRHVPVENVVRYIVDSGRKIFMFLDDNIIGEPKYAKELFRAIKPLKIKWVGQASISFVCDTELLRLAAESGCGGLFFGLESVSEYRLEKMRKSIKKIENVEEAIKKVKSFGIHFHASMVFGFDEDTKQTFTETLEFLNKNKVGSATFNILTPYPGTKIYQQFKKEGRLFTDDWRYYDHNTVVYKPKNLTPVELLAGRLWTRREFTKISAIMKRLPFNFAHPFLNLALNIGARYLCKNQIKNFPKLASELFRLENNAIGKEEKLSLELFRYEDFMPKKIASVGQGIR